MNHTVWKFNLEIFTPINSVEVPKGAEILTVQIQRRDPVIWALVDPEAELEDRHFLMHPTGSRLPDRAVVDPKGTILDTEGATYIGTVQINNGSYVTHVFEVKLEKND